MPIRTNILASNWRCWLLYFVIILSSIAVAHHGDSIPLRHDGVGMFAPPEVISKHFGFGDPGSFVNAARRLQAFDLRAFYDGGYGMFPPGLPVVEAVLMSISPHAPLPLILLLAAAALWATFMLCLFRAAQDCLHLSRRAAFLLPLLLVPVPLFWGALLWRTILYTESLAIPLFAIACLESWHIIVRPEVATTKRAIVIGLLFAMASYIRAQFDFVFLGFSAVSLGWLLLAYSLVPKSDPGRRYFRHGYAYTLLTVFIAYHALVLPYKALYKKASTMVVLDYLWEQLWTEDAYDHGAEFLANGGFQSVCSLAPEQCAHFAARKSKKEALSIAECKQAAMNTILHRPFSLLSFKLPYFWKNWNTMVFPEKPERGLEVMSTHYLDAPLLGAPLLIIILLGWSRPQGRLRRVAMYLSYLAALVVGSVGFSFIFHFEPRYFLPIKLFLLMSLLLSIAYRVAGPVPPAARLSE
jgi:hypothetical protein